MEEVRGVVQPPLPLVTPQIEVAGLRAGKEGGKDHRNQCYDKADDLQITEGFLSKHLGGGEGGGLAVSADLLAGRQIDKDHQTQDYGKANDLQVPKCPVLSRFCPYVQCE